ncbi:phage portal protein, lambda family [Onishia taeanensis]|uniref:Phage portal protein, lambda family n=1 Tax=Onishia taeanensis TaxID=284577 RepID=A0A1G7NEZ5_9GAMM|nr:phage portal protein [Halomonas taeanensis]SDF72614.1 phage portal protein, lambda family [Halomonas taeanensis]
MRLPFFPKPEASLASERERFARDEISRLRQSQQSTTANVGSETRHRGASQMVRSMLSWLPGLGSPRQDAPTGEREMLISRSRDAYRNHMLGRAAINRAATNVVGMGLSVRPNVDAEALGLKDDEANAINGELARGFRLWAENPLECDAEGALDFYMLQRLAFISAMVSGDVLGMTPYSRLPGHIFGTKLQLIEAERVSNGLGQRDKPDEIDGVRIDGLGRATHYRVCRGYPSDHTTPQDFDWVPVYGERTGRRRVLHLMNEKGRPGEVRGVPYLAPILEALQKLERFSQAELTAAVISAMFTVAIKHDRSEDPEDLGTKAWDSFSDDPNKANPVVSSSGGGKGEGDNLTLGEGAIWNLDEGAEPVAISPNRPNAQFDPFFMAIVKEIGAALEQPSEVLLMHFSTSYTAARAAFNQLWKFIKQRRHHLGVQFCQPTYELVIDELVARGMVKLPGYRDPAKRRAYVRALWVGEPLGALNEQVEARAATERIANGTSNETLETMALHGEDWLDVAQDRAREIRWKRNNGVPVFVGGKVHDSPNPDDVDKETE